MNGRKFLGQQDVKKPLSPEKKEEQKKKATCYMVLKFHDGKVWSKWSNEFKQPKLTNINDSINEMFRICQEYFTGRIASGALFDVRTDKNPSGNNKIYQFEKGYWKMVKPVHW